MEGRPPRILILTASIGEGHDLPAELLRDGIRELEPAAAVEVTDFLDLVRPVVRRVIVGGSQFHSELGARLFDLEYHLITEVRPTIWLARTLFAALGLRGTAAAVAAFGPDAVITTYPGATEALGRLRERGQLDVPVASAITDLAALRYWAHPAIDLHLIIHPESEAEVRVIAPRSEIRCVRGLSRPEFYEPLEPAEARRALELSVDGDLVLVSGGGWAVGDLAGAVEVARALGAAAVCLCGRNEEVRAELERRFAADDAVTVLGFSERLPELMAAADVLVHSTAGLTVQEALIGGCRVISYGWGHGHVRVNNAAYARFGLARVAADRAQLAGALRAALAEPRRPDRSFASLPGAAELTLELARRRLA